MSTASLAPTERQQRRRRAFRWMHLVIGAAAVLHLVAWALAPTVHADGRCTGLGFGCTPSPRDALLFAALLLWPGVAVAYFIVGHPTVWLLAQRIRSWVAGVLAGLATLLVGPLLSGLYLWGAGVLHG